MLPSGWFFMGVSWGAIIALHAYCLYRTLRPRD